MNRAATNRADAESSIENGLRVADMLVRVGDNRRAFDMYMRVAERYARAGRPLEGVAVGFRALAVDANAFASVRGAGLLRQLGEPAAPLCLRCIQVLLEREQIEDAVVMAEVLLVLNPNDVQARHTLADLYRRTQRSDEALALLDATCRRLDEKRCDRELIATARLLLRIEPNHGPTLHKLTLACLRAGQPAAALAAGARLLEARPDDPRAFVLMAEVYVRLQRPAQAIEALRRMADALVRYGGTSALTQADIALARTHLWQADDSFHRGVAGLRAELRAGRPALGETSADEPDPLASVPDAPDLLDLEVPLPDPLPPANIDEDG